MNSRIKEGEPLDVQVGKDCVGRVSLSPLWPKLFIGMGVLVWCASSVHGQIQFGPARAFSGAIGGIFSGDLDGDNDIDLVTDDGGGGLVSVLLNNGDATFAAPVDYMVPMGVRAFTGGDVNGDTFVDLVLVRAGPFPAGDGIVTVLLNQGDGSFGMPIDYSVIASGDPLQQLTPLSVAVGDFDNNGTVDVAAATVLLSDVKQPGFFSVIFNLGNDALGQPLFGISVNIDPKQSFSRSIIAHDLDNDTDIDLAVASSLGNSVNTVSVVLNNGDGTFGAARTERLTGGSTTARNLIVGDVNGDNFPDLITINGAHTYSIQLNLAGGANPANAGQFSDQGQFPLGSQALPATDVPSGGAALEDLDGDGDRDLAAGLVGDGGPGSLAVFANPGSGLFGPEMSFGACLDFGSLAADDFDGDGDIDIAATDTSRHLILVMRNEHIPSIPPPGDPTDADGDGVPDCMDGCPFDPNKTAPGMCGCGNSDVDTDNDGTPDCLDNCPNDPNKITPGVCGCADAPINGPCDDGDLCTGGEMCSGGACVGGQPLTCDDGNPCTTDACNPISGCVNTNNVAPCDDGNACTTADTCFAGACVGGAPPNCDDANACTDDSCDMVSGCIHTNNVAPCDDGNACTTADACSAGACVGGAPPNCDDANICTADSCDPASGCVNDGTGITFTCDDGNACTTADTCSAGACVGGAPPNCDDANLCTDDSCDMVNGCVHTNNVAPCDDGNACTASDTCSAGACVGGAPPNCDDANVCTDDSCDMVGGCVHTNNVAPCDDGNACTASDTCSAGACVGGAPPNCDDVNACTDDSCDMINGCVHTNNVAPCDDGNACTTADTCSAGACVGGAPPNCDDGDVCTVDSCDPASGCMNLPNMADSDNDGTPDCLDGCPNDFNKTAPGQCGCGVVDPPNGLPCSASIPAVSSWGMLIMLLLVLIIGSWIARLGGNRKVRSFR